LRCTPHLEAELFVQVIMDADPGPILFPDAEVFIGCTPMRQIMWQQAPGASGAEYVLNGVDNLAHGVAAMSAAGFFGRQERFEYEPLEHR